jgi:uncharacterized protein YpmB
MKKFIIVIFMILCGLFLLMINLLSNIDKDNNKKINTIKYYFKTKNNISKISDIYFYNDNKTYIIIKYKKDNNLIYSNIDKNGNVLDSIYNDKIIDKETILKNHSKKSEIIVGYMNDGFIYEIKEPTSLAYEYYYYNIVDGKIIKKINIKK